MIDIDLETMTEVEIEIEIIVEEATVQEVKVKIDLVLLQNVKENHQKVNPDQDPFLNLIKVEVYPKRITKI